MKVMLEEVLQHSNTKFINDNFHNALARLEDKWHVIESADHALRELGPLGEMITTVGKDFVNFTNKHISKMKEAITPVAAAIAQNRPARTQYSYLRQALHAIPSEDAARLIYDPDTKKIIKSYPEFVHSNHAYSRPMYSDSPPSRQPQDDRA